MAHSEEETNLGRDSTAAGIALIVLNLPRPEKAGGTPAGRRADVWPVLSPRGGGLAARLRF